MEDKTLEGDDHLLFIEGSKPYEIPIEGSLGLLAYGYKGLMAWRQKRNLMAQQAKNDNTKKL